MQFAPVGTGWSAVSMLRDVALPTQDCCCHRIELITGGGLAPHLMSAVVSELSSSRIFQLQLGNLEPDSFAVEEHSLDGDGHNVLTYSSSGGAKAWAGNRERMKELYLATTAMLESLPQAADGAVTLPGMKDDLSHLSEESRSNFAKLNAAQAARFHSCHSTFVYRGSKKDENLVSELAAAAPAAKPVLDGSAT